MSGNRPVDYAVDFRHHHGRNRARNRPAEVLVGDIAAKLPPGSVPFQPWAEKLYEERRDNNSVDDPTASCIVGGVPRSDLVPYPFKIFVPDTEILEYICNENNKYSENIGRR